MCFFEVKTAATRYFPKEGDGIQAEYFHASLQVLVNDGHELFKYLRIAEVKVYLVVPEGAPDVLRPLRCNHFSQ